MNEHESHWRQEAERWKRVARHCLYVIWFLVGLIVLFSWVVYSAHGLELAPPPVVRQCIPWPTEDDADHQCCVIVRQGETEAQLLRRAHDFCLGEHIRVYRAPESGAGKQR